MWRSERPAGSSPRLLVAAFAVAALGCVEHGVHQALTPFDYEPLPVPETRPAEEGAIWRGDSPSGSFLFFDQKARGVGDLVTVFIREDISAEGRAATDLDRNGTISTDVTSDVGFGDLVSSAIENVLDLVGIDDGVDVAAGETVNVLQSNAQSTFEGEGTTTRSGKFTAVLTCRVIDVLPGNVFHIKGRRSLLVNHEEQFLTLEALVRQDDIRIDNTVSSASLAEARLTMDGIGVLDDKQRPGWLARILDWTYPF